MLRFCMVALRLMLNYDRTAISVNFGLIEVFFLIIIIYVPEKKNADFSDFRTRFCIVPLSPKLN